MQTDMHYYGTYAIARLAGFTPEKAEIIAYSAQFVDDSTKNDSKVHRDGGMLYGIATAHHNLETINNAKFDLAEQRRVWIPFHFLPGAEGDTTSKQLTCRKNSPVANDMFDDHIEFAKDSAFGYHLIGIASHVYADTFSHYGFSGISSRENEIDESTLELHVVDASMKATLLNKFGEFMTKYAPSFIISNWRKLVLGGAQEVVGYLGHGGVGTFPDRPYLKWQFNYKQSNELSVRNNAETFQESYEKLYEKLLKFGVAINPNHKANASVDMNVVGATIKEIISTEADQDDRIKLWKKAILENKLFIADDHESDFLAYDFTRWEKDKTDTFVELASSAEGVNLDVYKFHQAAAHHRYYVLKDLLPKYGLAVY